MKRRMLGGKIHRATVTGADIDYEGSVSIDADLMEAAGILEHEAVDIWDITNGARLTTYTIAAPRGSGVICINGAAAHHIWVGDLVIIASFIDMDDEEAREWRPRIVFVDAGNRPKETRLDRQPGQ